MSNPTSDLIRVFDRDPDLLAGVEEPATTHLRTRMTARRVWVERVPWLPTVTADERRGHLGLLIIDGLLVRTLHLAGRESSEVIGPGDLIRPWDADDASGSVACASEWRVLTSSYGTRQSNKSSNGGGAIYGCRSLPGGSPANNEPCIRANNLNTGLAFEFETDGTISATISAKPGDACKPFITNATGVTTGLKRRPRGRQARGRRHRQGLQRGRDRRCEGADATGTGQVRRRAAERAWRGDQRGRSQRRGRTTTSSSPATSRRAHCRRPSPAPMPDRPP